MNPRFVSFCLALWAGAWSAEAQHAYRELREFGFIQRAASQPLSGLTEGPAEWLYGASQGGQGSVIYRVKKDGTEFSIVFDFAVTNGFPSRGTLIAGSDGALYGTMMMPNGFEGGVYRIQPDGTGFAAYALPIEAQIMSGVIEGTDGGLYGTTFGGGAFEGGTVFRINKDGGGFETIHDFAGGPADGLQPAAEPLEGSDGQLYVVTSYGGLGNGGVVCRMTKAGAGFLVLHHFPSLGANDGRIPNSRLFEGPGGYLYGATGSGGIGGEEDFFAGFGVVYRISNDGDIYSVLRRFEASFNDGEKPRNVFLGADGLLYGTCQNAGYARNVDAIFRMDTAGGDFNLVYSWVTADNQTIQLNPVLASADGNFYGTSVTGGASNAGQAFKVRPNGTQYLNVHEFSLVGGDGSAPWTVLQDADGTLYGSTLSGGLNNSGTIYKLETNGAYRVLHNFAPDSGFPLGLLAGSDGFLYGSSYFSGDVFRLGKDGLSYVILNTVEGSPVGPLIEGTDFLLYGVTEDGGTHERGSVFRLNPDGTGLQEIHSFTNLSKGLVAPAGILEGSDGRLYGAALRGGSSDQGMVFALNKDGSQYQVLYSFVAPIGTLVAPNPVTEGSDGYLYGTTSRGGGDGRGMIYRIQKSGGYEFLHSFDVGKGGPIGKLVEGPGGWLYGVTQDSGDFEGGYLFRFRIGPSSVIHTLHHFGKGNLGRNPGTGVALGAADEVYGTTQYGGFGSGFGALFQVDLRPVLAIRKTGADLELSWPWNGENYVLQATPNLGSNWMFSAAGATNGAERVTATVPVQSGAWFYRLEKAAAQPGGGQ